MPDEIPGSQLAEVGRLYLDRYHAQQLIDDLEQDYRQGRIVTDYHARRKEARARYAAASHALEEARIDAITHARVTR